MSAPETERAGVPLKIFLARLIGLCVAPLLALAMWLAYDSVRSADVQRDQEAEGLARNVATAVDQRLDARIRALNLLAVSPLLDHKTRWRDLYREAQGFQQSFGSHVILADVGEPMHMLFNTRSPFGAPLPLLPRPKGHAAAPAAVATKRPAVGDSFVGPVAKERLVAVAVPALRDGKPAFVLLTTFETRQFQARLDRFALPPGWSMTLLDGRGDVIARRSPPGFDAVKDVDPEERFVARSAVAPWSVVLEIPRGIRRASMLKTGLGLGLGVLGATLVAVLSGLSAGRRLSREVASLAQPRVAGDNEPEILEVNAARSQLEAAGAALRQSEARFRRLFEEAPVPMGHVGHDGAMLALNARFERVFGYTLKELPTVEDWWRRAYPDPDYRDEVRESWEGAVRQAAGAGTETAPTERRVIRKDGAERTVQISSIVTPEGVLATFMDVTESRLAEARLRLWAEAFEHSQLGLAISAPRTNAFVAVNPAFASQHGYDPEELVGLPVMTVFPEDVRTQVRERIAEVDEKGHGLFESEHLGKDGRRFPVLLDITVLWDESGRPLNRVAYALDMTEHRRAEKELREAQAAALEQQTRARVAALNQMQDASAARAKAETAEAEVRRLNADLERRVAERTAELTAANQELDSFAYAVSHDLRAPLRAMSGFSQALIEDCGSLLHGDAETYLQQIDLAGRRMGELIDGLLALSRTTRGELRRDAVDLTATAQRVLAELARREPGREVTVEVEPGLTVGGDARMLEAALSNLLENAWKYTAKTTAPSIRVYAEELPGGWWICIADNGAGFDPAHAKRLFQPFQRLHRQDEFPGIGIGLATVQRIIHRHGGEIEATAEPGRGATFRFTLSETPADPPGAKREP